MRVALDTCRRETHPVDVIEQITSGYGWSFERTVQDEISVYIAGCVADYHVSFSWIEQQEALHLSCSFNLSVPSSRVIELVQLLALINEKMLLGHFDYWQSGVVMYRQALLLSGGLHPTNAQIETLLATALNSCEVHYAACHKLVSSDISSRDALRYVMFNTVGNA